MADLRRARVSVFGVFRGAGSERGRGENGGEQRGARGAPYPVARRAREVGTTRGGASDRAGRYNAR